MEDFEDGTYEVGLLANLSHHLHICGGPEWSFSRPEQVVLSDGMLIHSLKRPDYEEEEHPT